MQERHIEIEELRTISERDESHFFERKALGVKGREIQKAVVAFANADGGELIIGIRDPKHAQKVEERWQGADSLEDLNGYLQAVFEVQPAIDVRYEVLLCEGKPGRVLRLNIEKSSAVCKTGEGTVYVRQGAQSLPIKDADRITQLTFAKGASSYEDQKLEEVPPEQIVDGEPLRTFLHDYSPKTDPLDFCVNQNLLDYRSWAPRVCSALLFHPVPSAVIPKKCAVKVTRYETKEDDPEREHLAEQFNVEGPLYDLIHDSVERIQSVMEGVSIRTASGLKKAEYPPEAIWEILVNALIHRDYSISDDVQVLIYDNRIEVLSPGRLPGYVTVENILDARFSRNPKIVRTLNRYPESPNKDLGEGLNTAFQKMKEFGLEKPIVEESGNYLKVTLPHTPLAAPSEAILEFLLHESKITNRQAREITGIKSENMVKTEFYKLRDDGLIERVPGLAGAKAAWQLTQSGKKKANDIVAASKSG
jgi:ATP-dependent DNA helicase RecG